MKHNAPVLRGIVAALALAGALAAHAAEPLKANVIHWWTSGGESAAIKQFALAYDQAGGKWVDNAIAGADQARATAINRIVGGEPPTAAQFNTSKQFHDLIDQGLLNNVDAVATKENWGAIFPESIVNAIRINGHYYATPVNIHMQDWFFYSKPAFAKAGIKSEPQNFDELFGDLDKLKAAGLIPLALGGQAWQEKITFDAIFADMDRDLYMKVYRDRDANAVKTPAFRNVLTTFKRLHNYVDPGSPGRNWNDATALVISGKAGMQIMGDWAKGEFSAANQVAGKDFGCFPGFKNSPYMIAGDVFVFPKTDNPEQVKAQQLLATVMTSPAAQVAFNQKKGSIPIRPDVDTSGFDICAKEGMAIMKDKSRQLPNPEMLIPPDVQGALQDVITNFWNKNQSAEDAQNAFASAIKS
ncbi:ABC transporter substrate-binding protein [Paraburkholderia silvatlantica]|uniref:Probable sugar-binding periplasmic protein n=1 Tax=Paraburkholderia silvatlantica TaxID=321895 RepID=A0A2U1AHY0_9BURK|nr:ABC transporter substrate-binding protein [Paraburkholderia silvatlantica]MBB2929317.1 glucose/mannose transport system substrate-binding protein [Paraburkholderia silvatlantica]PVY35991.1 carbohydrate ABC transporter substrate-binding protein (CUT1 family) [Paraburkholderia silvatlantica]PXW39939.1 carbohydrate ABC transporter substrate-binding protein (CUT1 family) [Paraburkholderia silvatlantica]PYE19713.1 carbohydrate ABC transporter substrate-binding protein (CUT1 family) [Paraburkholde